MRNGWITLAGALGLFAGCSNDTAATLDETESALAAEAGPPGQVCVDDLLTCLDGGGDEATCRDTFLVCIQDVIAANQTAGGGAVGDHQGHHHGPPDGADAEDGSTDGATDPVDGDGDGAPDGDCPGGHHGGDPGDEDGPPADDPGRACFEAAHACFDAGTEPATCEADLATCLEALGLPVPPPRDGADADGDRPPRPEDGDGAPPADDPGRACFEAAHACFGAGTEPATCEADLATCLEALGLPVPPPHDGPPPHHHGDGAGADDTDGSTDGGTDAGE